MEMNDCERKAMYGAAISGMGHVADNCASEAAPPTIQTIVEVPANNRFEQALDAVKSDRRIARAGWDGKGQYVEAQYPDIQSRMSEPYLVLRNAQGGLVPWAPSQGDLFARDWAVLPR